MPFRFETYQPQLTGSILELMQGPARARANALRLSGQAQANAALQSGQAWGNAAQGIGNAVSGSIGAILQDREQQPQREMQALQLDAAKRANEQTKRADAEDQALRALFSRTGENGAAMAPEPEEIYRIVGPTRGNEIIKGLRALQVQGVKDDKDLREWVAAGAGGVLALPPGLRYEGYQALKQKGASLGIPAEYMPEPENQQQLDQYLGQAQQWALSAKDQIELGKPKLFSAAPGATLFDQNNLAAGPVATVPPRPTQKSYQAKSVLLNGKEAEVSYDPQTGQYFVPGANGQMQDVTARVKPMPPASVRVNVGGTQPEPETAPDPSSANILSQTGLSINAFRYLTGQTSQLARDKVTREKAAREAGAWARKHNVDISTLPAQYKAQNDVLQKNIERLNNTKIMEQELAGTVQNIEGVSQQLGTVKFANVWKLWAGEQVNDPTAQQYAFHLGQLRNELAAYYAAAAGRPGSGITITDLQEAERTIKNGIASGGLKGIANAVHDSTAKMGPIMQNSVDRAQQAVWTLFGVGQNYKNKATGGGTTQPTHRYNPQTGKVEAIK